MSRASLPDTLGSGAYFVFKNIVFLIFIDMATEKKDS